MDTVLTLPKTHTVYSGLCFILHNVYQIKVFTTKSLPEEITQKTLTFTFQKLN